MKKFLLLFALAVVAMPCGAHCPSNEIWYTNGSTTEPTKLIFTFGVNIISNTYDSEKECWVIKFDGNVTTIGDLAFGCCTNLTSITIPDSVTTIGAYAFCYCSSLTSVYCKATTPPAGGSSMFSYNASDRMIYVPMESVEAYRSASYWSNYNIVGYNF